MKRTSLLKPAFYILGITLLFISSSCQNQDISNKPTEKAKGDTSTYGVKHETLNSTSLNSKLFKAYALRKLDSLVKQRSAAAKEKSSKTTLSTNDDGSEAFDDDYTPGKWDGNANFDEATLIYTSDSYKDFISHFGSYFDNRSNLKNYFEQTDSAKEFELVVRRSAAYQRRPTSVNIEIPIKYVQVGYHNSNASVNATKFETGGKTMDGGGNNYVYLSGTYAGSAQRTALTMNVYDANTGNGDYSTTILETVINLKNMEGSFSIGVEAAAGIAIISGSVMTSTEITKALQTATYHTSRHEVRGEFSWKSPFSFNTNGQPVMQASISSIWHPQS